MRSTIILIIGSLFIGISSVLASDGGEPEIGGLRVGYHVATLSFKNDKPDSAQWKEGFYIGFRREQKLSYGLSYGSGIEYFQNGIKYTGNTSRVLHTISVPIHMKYQLGPLFALGGVSANFKVDEKIVIHDEKINPLESDKSNWFDAPVFVGAGVSVLFIAVEARYHWGLIEARNGMHNRYFQLGIAFSY